MAEENQNNEKNTNVPGEKICPLLSMGWLSNKYSAYGSNQTFTPESLPKCLKENCEFWVSTDLNRPRCVAITLLRTI